MRDGLPVRVAKISLLPTIALMGALSPPLAAAELHRSRVEEGAALTPEAAELLTPKRLRDTSYLENIPNLEDRKGKLRPPVTGTVVRRFGEKDREDSLFALRGICHGVTLRARAGEIVVAPFYSTIMFAGPHKDDGQVLILSTSGGYHFVLAGMTKIYGVEGGKLLEGEPVGHMVASGENAHIVDRPRATGTSDALSTSAGPELCFEIRKDGKPINPLPWLATARLERTSQ